MNHTIQKNVDGTFAVGYWGPQLGGGVRQVFYSLISFSTFKEAARWVHFLNGGPNQPE